MNTNALAQQRECLRAIDAFVAQHGQGAGGLKRKPGTKV
jgi:hypothetical protein